MAALPNLGVVVNFGVEFDAIDIVAATARGWRSATPSDVLTDCVADTGRWA